MVGVAYGGFYLGKGTIVPKVTLMGEAVAYVAKLSFLDVLFDRVQWLLFGDLRQLLVSPDGDNVRFLSTSIKAID